MQWFIWHSVENADAPFNLQEYDSSSISVAKSYRFIIIEDHSILNIIPYTYRLKRT